MGVSLTNLLNSKIFSVEFDFDQWPSTHNDEATYMRPYNFSIFKIRKHYRTVFPEDNFLPIDEQKGVDRSRIFKIKYSMNLLPKIGVHARYIKDANGRLDLIY